MFFRGDRNRKVPHKFGTRTYLEFTPYRGFWRFGGAVRWRFGGAPGSFVAGRGCLVGASLQIAPGGGGDLQEAGAICNGVHGASLRSDNKCPYLRSAIMLWRFGHESPLCTLCKLFFFFFCRPVYESPHGPPRAKWRFANESPSGSTVLARIDVPNLNEQTGHHCAQHARPLAAQL